MLGRWKAPLKVIPLRSLTPKILGATVAVLLCRLPAAAQMPPPSGSGSGRLVFSGSLSVFAMHKESSDRVGPRAGSCGAPDATFGPNSFHARCLTVRDLIDEATDSPVVVTTNLDWIDTARFAVDGKMDHAVPLKELKQGLLGSLTAACQLDIRETKQTSTGFALQVAPGGIKFKPLPAGAEAERDVPPQGESVPRFHFRTLPELAAWLDRTSAASRQLDGKRVVDETGLDGEYAITFVADAMNQVAVAHEVNTHDDGSEDYVGQLEKQLGLTLVRKDVTVVGWSITGGNESACGDQQ